MAFQFDYNKLRDATLVSGQEEEAVTVNTRALIDKVLARYSGEWTTLRELVQNAADAGASKVKIQFETIPSTTIPAVQNPDEAAELKHTILNHTLRRLVVSNNGHPFGKSDWARLKRIAEGNPDETKIGAFGVGFYSVFADCENPFVSSGSETMAFYWKGNSLFTRKGSLPEGTFSSDTCFVLDYRNTSSKVPDIMSISKFLCSSLTFIGLESVELWLDRWQLFTLRKKLAPTMAIPISKDIETKTKEGLMRLTGVDSQSSQIDVSWMNVVGWTPMQDAIVPGTGASTTSPSLRSFFSRLASTVQSNATVRKAAKEEERIQKAISEDVGGKSQVTLFIRVSTIQIKCQVTSTFASELERATKKPPPKHTKISVLTSSYDETSASQSTLQGTASSKATELINSILPFKNGRIFIGFPTVQTSGLKAHISIPSLIPTVERESIDLNARFVRTWNMELLSAAGIACRIAYDGELSALRAQSTTAFDSSNDFDSSVLSSASHTFNQFTFCESTPLPKAGYNIEEAFWACNKRDTIEVLSTKGILASKNVRIASENLSFVHGIPIIPERILKDSKDFVRKLQDFGFIYEITTTDIKKELARLPLSETQFQEFLQWLANKISSSQIDVAAALSMFDETVIQLSDQPEDSAGQLLMLGGIKSYVNPSKIPPELPIPPQTLPFRLSKSMTPAGFRVFGWDELQIVPWLRWLVEEASRNGLRSDQNIFESQSFAMQILPVLSRAWDDLGQSSKQSVIELIAHQTVIPTKRGMKKPSESYFASVKLFDDLPTISPAVSNVKEKFLKTLGVRKTIELPVIFERLMSTSATSSEKNAKWSHVDLIKYLVSVRNDIPEQDLALLRRTPLCPAEDSTDRRNPSGQSFIVAELYEPKDAFRILDLNVLHWPVGLEAASAERQFLKSLGLRGFPSAPDLVTTLIRAHSCSNFDLYEFGLKYFLENHYSNNYGSFDLGSSGKAFLPVQGDTKLLTRPNECYANANSAVLGFKVLRQDLRSNALKLGVSADPPIIDCATRLVKNIPTSQGEAKAAFDYFAGRLNEVNGQVAELLRNARIVPLFDSKAATGKSLARHVSPGRCFLGDSQEYGEIFDYVDFGHEANTFLLKVGSKHEPSIPELAKSLVQDPVRLLRALDSPEKYLALLRKLYTRISDLKRDKLLWKEMKRSPFLLAYKNVRRDRDGIRELELVDDELEPTYKEWALASAEDIVIVDDVISFTLFRDHLRAAPEEDSLEDLYWQLGTRSVSSLVDEQPRLGSPSADQTRAQSLRRLIFERVRLFLHDQPEGSVRRDAKWLEKHLQIQLVHSISLRRELRGYGIAHTEKRSAALTYDAKRSCLLSVTSDYDYWQVSQAITLFVLERPKTQHILILETLLSTPLEKLRSRGYNVDRILRRKAEEARLAQIVKQKESEKETKQQDELPTEHWKQQSQRESGNKTSMDLPQQMPGAFNDAPDPIRPSEKSLEPDRTPNQPSKRGGLLSSIFKQIGSSSNSLGRSHLQNMLESTPSLPTDTAGVSGPNQYSLYDPKQIKGPTQGEAVTDPQRIQKNLTSAISASRAHNSTEVFSKPQTMDVKEQSSYCDTRPGQDISFFASLNTGMKVFLAKTVKEQSAFYSANVAGLSQFSQIILSVGRVYGMPEQSLHIFHDEGGNTIAFNQNGSIFCNFRFFAQLHLGGLHGSQGMTQAFVYYFVTVAHELAHNLVSEHGSSHSYYTEQFVAEYFPKAMEMLLSRPLGPHLQPQNGTHSSGGFHRIAQAFV